ncbi:hypothetical protein J4E85_001023 [Alternaria conjuncta]|uniref:uncharacterized protein n=1 Tax=Alternaria conjuncta TaxID=181017 RepID=UPI00221FE8C2|nr:uncharacterized protein J4E85_001023 [Alternaria conjuncta]KAI4938582.1 hypothetical protein J4E85_001023 [Alternaria conjuncta]
MSRPSQSSDTRDDIEARELTEEVATTVTAFKTRLDDDTTIVSAYSQSVIDPVSKVNENESRLRRERDAALCTVGEQKRKLNNLYTKIGQLWEENDALKENTTTSKDQEKSTEELCGACRVKDAEIAQLHEQIDSAGESSEESKEMGSRTQECNLALIEAKTDPDEDTAQTGLRIAYFKAEEELRTKDLAHAAEIVKIKEEHGILATRLYEEVRDARTTTNEEHAERLCTQEQLSSIAKELSNTKKQLFDSEEQYQILYDIIPKPGGGRMAKPPLPAIPLFSHNGEVESSSPSVPRASSLVPTDHSHRSHSQDKEASSTPSHISNGSKSSRDQHTLERTCDATRAPPSSTPPKRVIDQVDDAASPAPISKRGPGRPRKVTSTHYNPRAHPPPESETPSTIVVDKPSHKLDQDQLSIQRPKKRRTLGFGPYKPKLSSADDIPWLFCVAGEGEGIRYHTLDDLSPEAQAIVTERFQYWFSASNNAQYNPADTYHHNDYARMVKEGNRLANVGAGCVQNMVFAKGRPSKTAKQTGEHEACGSCQSKGSPCVRMILHDGNPVLCWYRQGSVMSSITTWQDAAYWIKQRSSTIEEPEPEPLQSTDLAEPPVVPHKKWCNVERYALWRCINKWCKEHGVDAFTQAKFNLATCSNFADQIKTDCGAQGKESDRSAESVRAQFRGALRPLDPTEPNKPITELADRAEKLRAKIESGDYVSVDERYPEAAINIPGDDKSDAGL